MDDISELLNVCSQYLDDADLSIYTDINSDTVKLEFIVGGSLERVTFICSSILLFTYRKDWEDDENCFFVGGTGFSVSSFSDIASKLGWASYGDRELSFEVYKITTEGGIDIELLCRSFDWKLEPHGSYQC